MSFNTRHEEEENIKELVDNMFEFYHRKTCAEIGNDEYHTSGKAYEHRRKLDAYKVNIISAIEKIF